MSTEVKTTDSKRKGPTFERYIPYMLNWNIFKDEPCKIGVENLNGKIEFNQMTFLELIQLLEKKKITETTKLGGQHNVKFNDTEYKIECTGLADCLLPILLKLISQEGFAVECYWYYYDEDHVLDDFHEFFSFFLVNGAKIVLENATISHASGAWLNSDFLKYEPNDFTHNEAGMRQASAVWWYKKFYSQTNIGQIVSIRERLESGYSNRQVELGTQSLESKAISALILKTQITNVLVGLVLVLLLGILFRVF